MELLSLRAQRFRNLSPQWLEFASGFNLVTGDNGQGKTNLLEAVAVLTSLRSFRTANHRRLVRHGEHSYHLEGRLRGSGDTMRLGHEVVVGPPSQRELRIDDRSVAVDRYLATAPIVSLTPNDRTLVAGEPSVRRAFLDRFAFLLEPAMYDDVRLYRRSLRQRNAGLASGIDDRTLAAFEAVLARSAAAVVDRRRRALARLDAVFQSVYPTLAGSDVPEVALRYRLDPGLGEDLAGVALENGYLERYTTRRARDRVTGFTVEGPHRHDLGLRACGRPVRDVLSAGQSKVVVAALRLAMLQEIERERGERLPVIVDDIDAELDRAMLGRLVRQLGSGRQVVVSSADGERVMAALPGGSRLHLVAGACHGATRFGD